MTRALLISTAVLAVSALLDPAAQQAQTFCVDFDPYCDGLELNIEGDRITGYARNVDCEGTDAPVVGVIYNGVDVACGPEVGRVAIACEKRFGCEIFGDEWYWTLNEVEGNFDLGHSEGGGLDPPGAYWLSNIRYDILVGPCPFFAPGSGRSLLSTIQARE